MRPEAFIPEAAGLVRQFASRGAGGMEVFYFQRPADAPLPPDAEERWELLEAIKGRIQDPEGARMRLALLRHLARTPAGLFE